MATEGRDVLTVYSKSSVSWPKLSCVVSFHPFNYVLVSCRAASSLKFLIGVICTRPECNPYDCMAHAFMDFGASAVIMDKSFLMCCCIDSA